ncbi:apolipoprotein N-acyltransferase [Pseudokineococcus sp. 1T1Z-3]|uniref:apolipoprotein N-acyltransferase n=1 Tax=Pseudokineococcus sp. 1T1Z-3 TaxID=3132745 RepID=UPI0030B51DF3
MVVLRLPVLVRVVAALSGGVALAASFPEPGWWWLAAPAVGLLVAAVAGVGVRTGALVGMVFGLAFFLPLLRWTAEYVGPVAHSLAVLQAAFCALAGALLVLVLRWTPGAGAVSAQGPVPGSGWAPPPSGVLVLQALAAGGAWTGVEALRARIPFGGFGWGRVAFSQADAPTLGLAAVGGAPLVSFAVATTGAALALVALRLLVALAGRRSAAAGTAPPPRTRALAALAAPALLAVAAGGGGALVPRPVEAEAGTLTVAAVQGDVPAPGLEFNAERRAVLDNHVQGTLRLAEAVAAGEVPQPDLVVWPENASDIDPFTNADAYRTIDEAAQAVDAPLLVGTLVRGSRGTGLAAPEGAAGAEEDALRNVVLAWDPQTGPGQVYAKRHPVPFAEYVPYRDFFRTFSPAVDLVRADMVPGQVPGLLEVAGTSVGTLICFEPVVDGLVDDVVAGGAQLLVVPTNNATFGFTDESVQQLAISRVRAVEEGRAVVHASTVGVSAVIAPDGSTGRRTHLFTPDVLVTEVPLRTTRTLASRLGAWPEVGLSVLGGVVALAGALGGRRRRDDAPAAEGAGTDVDPEPVAVAPGSAR